MKRYVPFSNGSEAVDWWECNCAYCKTKCYYRNNMNDGFILGDISLKTAEFVGYESISKKFVNLNGTCQHKDKYIKRIKGKRINKNQLTLL